MSTIRLFTCRSIVRKKKREQTRFLQTTVILAGFCLLIFFYLWASGRRSRRGPRMGRPTSTSPACWYCSLVVKNLFYFSGFQFPPSFVRSEEWTIRGVFARRRPGGLITDGNMDVEPVGTSWVCRLRSKRPKCLSDYSCGPPLPLPPHLSVKHPPLWPPPPSISSKVASTGAQWMLRLPQNLRTRKWI